MSDTRQAIRLTDYVKENYPKFFEQHEHWSWSDAIIELIQKLDNKNNIKINVNYDNLDDKIERKVEEVIDRKIQEMANNVGRVGYGEF